MRKPFIAVGPLLIAVAFALMPGCATTPAFDDSKCVPSDTGGTCPTSYEAPGDSFSYKSSAELASMSFEQRLDYLGAIHKALLSPESYNTHRAPLLWKGEKAALEAVSAKDGAFTALAAVELTFDRPHPNEWFFDPILKEAQRDPTLVTAIQSRVPPVHGFDANKPRSDRYVMIDVVAVLYADVVKAAQKGDLHSCEMLSSFDLTNRWLQPWILPEVNIYALYDACARVAIPSQAMYQHRTALRAIQLSALHDDARVEQRRQEWMSKALALESKCRRVAVDTSNITYNIQYMRQVARDMQANYDSTYHGATEESKYRDWVSEKTYEYREASKYLDGALITPILTPYLYISAVGHSCG